MKNRTFLRNAGIMIASSFALRALSMWFRVFLSGYFAPSGMGTYQLIFSVFTAAAAMATSGMFLVSARLTSEALGKGARGLVRAAVCRCALYGAAASASAAALLLLFSGKIASDLIGSADTAASLRILAAGLPFMACCAVLRGYFVARENTLPPAAAELAEQAVTILIPLLLLRKGTGLSEALSLCMLGSSAGEVTSCLCLFVRYRIDLRKERLPRTKGGKLFREVLRISLPGSLASTARSLLSTAENLLIPRALRSGGVSGAAALSQYGAMQAMAMPTLTFPAAILIPFSSLLVPEIAKARVRGDRDAIAGAISFSLRVSLVFSIWMTCEFWEYAPYLGNALFENEAVSVYLRVLSPILPLLYTDSAVDGILKGLDQQFSSCRFNLYDGSLRIALLLLLVPNCRMGGYVAVLFVSAVFNGFLSMRRMLRVSGFHFPVARFVLLPLLFGALSILIAKILPLSPPLGIAVSSALYFSFLLIESKTAPRRDTRELPVLRPRKANRRRAQTR